jgi:rod shape determining protein RodA
MSKNFNKADSETINIGSYDRPILALYYILVFMGWLMIYTVNYKPNQSLSLLDLEAQPGKQFMFIVICSVMLSFIAFTNSGIWRILSTFFYIIGILLLVLVLFFGSEVNGANAWFRFGGFSFQPAEFAKFATAMAVANVASSSSVSLRDHKVRWMVAGLIFLPVGLILLQPDAGSALVFNAFLIPLYREGMNPSYIIVVACMAILVILGLIFPPAYVCGFLLLGYGIFQSNKHTQNLGIILLGITLAMMSFWWYQIFPWLAKLAEKPDLDMFSGQLIYFGISIVFLIGTYIVSVKKAKSKSEIRGNNLSVFVLGIAAMLVFAAEYFCFKVLAPHQQERIKVWLRPQECDPRGSLYNILHSKMAISSGGFSGKGFLEGNMTKLKYVPEQDTDFIICTIGEEQGFLGIIATLAFFAILVYRIIVVSERSRSNFTRIYGYTVAGIFMVHFVVNTGMTMGLFPVIGIPLPFISYGGSSLIGFTLLIGVFLKLARES